MEDSSINFTVDGEVVPWKRPRFNGKTKAIFEKAEVKEYKDKVITAFMESGGGHFEKDVPLIFELCVFMGVPKSLSLKKRLNLITEKRPTKRPDNDNLYKGIADALNGIAYYDDSQIVATHIAKFWSVNPHAVVTIREIK